MRSVKVLVGVLVCLPLLGSACGSDSDSPADTTQAPDVTEVSVPAREPDLIGTITEVTPSGDDDGLGSILVEGDLAPERGRKIVYTITTDTVITGTAAELADLADGQLAETWSSGPCAESYPEQCTLEAIRVTG
jgi:hypothetical protein